MKNCNHSIILFLSFYKELEQMLTDPWEIEDNLTMLLRKYNLKSFNFKLDNSVESLERAQAELDELHNSLSEIEWHQDLKDQLDFKTEDSRYSS